MVRQHDLVEFGDEPRWADQITESGTGHRPGLGEGPRHDEGPVVGQEIECRPVGELGVRLVDDHEPVAEFEQLDHPFSGFDEARRVVGRREEHDVGCIRGDHALDFAGVEGEVVPTSALDDGGPGDPCDLRMHLIGRLERRDRPPRPRVGEQHRLEHLVRSVGSEHLVRRHTVEVGDGGAQVERRPIGIAVPFTRDSSAANASRNASGGGSGDSLVLRRTATSTWAEWYPSSARRSSRTLITWGDASQRSPERGCGYRAPVGSSGTQPSNAAIESAATELAVIADSIGDYRARVADLATPFVGTTRDDLVTAIHEAERQLRNAERGLHPRRPYGSDLTARNRHENAATAPV